MNSSGYQNNEAATRSALYALLARSYLQEPDLELIRYFRRSETRQILAELDLTLKESFLKKEEGDLVRELELEYCRLFLTPPSHIPPYESFFIGGLKDPEEVFEPALQGKAAKEVQAFYREHGLILPEDTRHLPDHIGLELEALRLLCDLESKAEAEGKQDQVQRYRRITKKFLAEHPNRWIRSFCDAILRKAETPFYGVVAQLTRSFVKSELEELTPGGVEMEEVIQ